jgi:hypothetical protein
MAALSITAANVRSYGNRTVGIAGGTITQGQVVRKNTSQQIVVAVNDSAINAAACGIALNAASANQPVEYHTDGLLDPGATVAVGMEYKLGTAGGIIPVGDTAGGEFGTFVGYGTTASRLLVAFVKSGVAAAGAVT